MKVLSKPGMFKARVKSKRMFNYRFKDIRTVMEEENTRNPVLILRGLTQKANEREGSFIDKIKKAPPRNDQGDDG